METPDKSLVRKRFSRGLNTYSEAAVTQRAMAEKLTAMIVRRKKHFGRVLEIGAGTGLLTRLLEENITWKQRIVNDLAPECAPFHAGRRDTVFLPGDAETVFWGSEKFDLICSNAAFQWFADLPAFLKKLKNSLSSAGLLAFTTFGPDNLQELSALTGHSLPYYPVRTLADWLTGEGFTVLESSGGIRVEHFADPLEILKQIHRTGVGASSDRTWWTPRRLAGFCRDYRDRFGTPDRRVTLTWHPVYILAQTGKGELK